MSWKDTVRNVAPAIGRALGMVGVPGASALAAVSQALLGKPDATEAEVAARIANWSPADELAMKAAEQRFTLDMVDRMNRADEILADDRAGARDMQKTQRSRTPSVLTYSALALFAVSLVLMFFVSAPASNTQNINNMIEVLKLLNVTAFGFWLGGSFGSEQKTALLGKFAERK